MTTIQINDIVTVLRGSQKGYTFTVAGTTETEAVDLAGQTYKFGNLRIDGHVEPEDEIEEPVAPTRPKASRGRRPATTTEDLPLCRCGCGWQVLKRNRAFRQGHDQRYRGQLVRELETTPDEGRVEEVIDELMRHWFDIYTREELRSRAKGIDGPEQQGAVEVIE